IARVELDDGDDEPRLYDRAGRRVRPVTEADRLVFGATRAIQRGAPAMGRIAHAGAGGAFLAEAHRHAERRRDLQRRFGQPAGRVRGLDRFVTTTGKGTVHEVLATPDTALPVEART